MYQYTNIPMYQYGYPICSIVTAHRRPFQKFRIWHPLGHGVSKQRQNIVKVYSIKANIRKIRICLIFFAGNSSVRWISYRFFSGSTDSCSYIPPVKFQQISKHILFSFLEYVRFYVNVHLYCFKLEKARKLANMSLCPLSFEREVWEEAG